MHGLLASLIMFQGSSVEYNNASLIFIAQQYPFVYEYQVLFIHSEVDESLSHFYFLTLF